MNVEKEEIYIAFALFATDLLDELYERIKHGDDEHQRWLREEIDKFKNEITDGITKENVISDDEANFY